MSEQFGLRYAKRDGSTYDVPAFNRTAAESLYTAHSQPGWEPCAVAVLVRDVTDWRVVGEVET